MNINALDLNLLKVFEALYLDRNVSRAGERIGIAQSSMSNALNRLRDHFDDSLFQRTPKGMEPTARAEQLAPQISLILQNVRLMLEPEEFVPALVQEHIHIAASDLAVMTLAPKLMAYLSEHAPGIRLHFVTLEKQKAFQQLDDASLQLAIGTFNKVPAHLRRKVLSQDSFMCVTRLDHPRMSNGLTLDLYCQLSHLLMTLKADQVGVIDQKLKTLGRKRHIAMTCAEFSPMVEIVANSDLVATLPLSLSHVAERAGCHCYPLPFDMDSWQSEMVCTQKFHSDPLGKFILDAIAQSL